MPLEGFVFNVDKFGAYQKVIRRLGNASAVSRSTFARIALSGPNFNHAAFGLLVSHIREAGLFQNRLGRRVSNHAKSSIGADFRIAAFHGTVNRRDNLNQQ